MHRGLSLRAPLDVGVDNGDCAFRVDLQTAGMRVEVDTASVTGVSDAVRRAAARVSAVELPRSPACEDVGAADAVAALLAVSGETLASCSQALLSVGTLIEVAAIDYARAETWATAQ